MRSRISSRTISLIVCAILLWTSGYAQLELGPHRLVSVPAPTLRNRTRLTTGIPRVGRPRMSFVGKIGGVAFDSVATPATGFGVSKIRLTYLPGNRDGERLSLTINGQVVTAAIYDWQLIPIAKYANSNFYSCFTLFGELNSSLDQDRVLARGGRILNYHDDFVNTLMGLRVFQLDNLIINSYSYDLPKDGGRYVLGAGESAPDIEANKRGLGFFRAYTERNKELFSRGTSYVISDRERQVAFDIKDNKLNLYGEPSYYFWSMDEEALKRLETGEVIKQVEDRLLADIEELVQTNVAVDTREWLIQQLLKELLNYEQQIGDYRFLIEAKETRLVKLLSTRGTTAKRTSAARKAILVPQSEEDLLEQLIFLRILADVQQASPVPELSEKVSNETAMLRAINPSVWDAAVNLMRYAAFFRYCKQNDPKQWRLFMNQIRRAPAPQPRVITPTVMEAPSG